MTQAIEVVVFRAKTGVSAEQIQSAALAVTPLLTNLPGFIRREFGVSGDGEFVDIVHWQDLSSAKSAAEEVMTIPQCVDFFGLIDQSQMRFMHFRKAS